MCKEGIRCVYENEMKNRIMKDREAWRVERLGTRRSAQIREYNKGMAVNSGFQCMYGHVPRVCARSTGY